MIKKTKIHQHFEHMQTRLSQVTRHRHFAVIAGSAVAVLALSAVVGLSLKADTIGTVSFQAENATTNGVTVVSDNSAAGGSAIQFGSTGNSAPNTVQIGSQTFALTGTNIARGTNQIVRYTYSSSQTLTPTNQYGVEVVVNLSTNKVTSVNNRIGSGSTTGTTIPADSYVLSGHGGPGAEQAGNWLLTYATVGATVALTGSSGTDPDPDPDPGGTTGTVPMPYPTKAIGLYHMMWSNSGSPQLSTTPANVNVINIAFAQGDPPSLVGWASQSEASFIADAKTLRARGVRMVISVGGAGGGYNTSNRQAFVNGIMAINNKIPLDGLDWDLEGSAMNSSDMVWISQELKRLRGSNFAITMAPGGSGIHDYPPIAVQLNNVGALDMIGWQFYDTVQDQNTIRSRIDSLVSMGIPINKIGIGMMVGDANIYSTVDEWIGHVNYVKAKYPGIRGGYLWEAGRAGTADWANRVGNLLK